MVWFPCFSINFQPQRRHTRGRDLNAFSEIQRGELGAPLRQRDHTRVRDLFAVIEMQRGELGAPLRQRDHTRVRDLSAATEIHRKEPRAPFCVHAQPHATDAMRAPPALQHGPRVEQGGPHAEHLPARRQQRARLPQHAEIRDRAPCGRDREQHVLQGLPRLPSGVSGLLGAWIHPVFLSLDSNSKKHS